MALYKEIELESGVIAKYWHITHYTARKDEPDKLWVQLYAYVGERERFEGKMACHNEMLEVFIPITEDVNIDKLYQWIRTENLRFEGAENVFEGDQFEVFSKR